ncbi:hypothetical protein H257_10456 [Aphanomyces astaci]|uniref:FYVE-type domain-containing protein n=1 Tax=Aphanomyces astaci TaxID=112090 RepID=W4G6G9_APHAT|nr:hypothetical protein H257_10456 [Aphanomyces astaci]ETV75270.1 hypothetical protein H257_10456 [Aphanomyces astaci]RQM12483.1 hypothetical protein B5M09_007212 [Aphanomyces astaci]|eukprot:XP_009835318.1 hypothetical protein H257_10456 [Aphanomyces astaci]
MGVPAASATSLQLDFRSPNNTAQKSQPAPWQPDHTSDACTACNGEFNSWTRRRHHCRACGCLVCADCSPSLIALPQLGYATPVRVCKTCQPTTRTLSTALSNVSDDSSSDNEADALDEETLQSAFDEIACHARMKVSRYFVKSEAVNWLVDTGCTASRITAAHVFRRLVVNELVIESNDAFCINHGDARRDSYSVPANDSIKCLNCTRSFLRRRAPVAGFCSIDCKTNAEFSRSDDLRIQALCA